MNVFHLRGTCIDKHVGHWNNTNVHVIKTFYIVTSWIAIQVKVSLNWVAYSSKIVLCPRHRRLWQGYLGQQQLLEVRLSFAYEHSFSSFDLTGQHCEPVEWATLIKVPTSVSMSASVIKWKIYTKNESATVLSFSRSFWTEAPRTGIVALKKHQLTVLEFKICWLTWVTGQELDWTGSVWLYHNCIKLCGFRSESLPCFRLPFKRNCISNYNL